MVRNKIELIGHLGRDPESRHLDNGAHVCSYSLATTESWKDANGEWQKATEWHTIISWRKSADYAVKHLKKGSFVAISGKMTYRKFTDAKGIERQTAEVVSTSILKLEKSERKDGFDKITENPMVNFLRGNAGPVIGPGMEGKDKDGFIEPKA